MIGATIPMKINSEKKHSVRYDALVPDADIQSVYIMRKGLPSKIPQTLTIQIVMENDNGK